MSFIRNLTFRDNLRLAFLLSVYLGVAISFSKVYLFHLLLVIVWVHAFFHRNELIEDFRMGVLSTSYKFLILFIGWSVLTLAWTMDRKLTLFYIIYQIFGVSIVYFSARYLNTEKKVYLLLKSLLIVYCLEILVSILEIFTSFRYVISPYSDFVSWFGRSQSSKELCLQKADVPTGFHWNPNDLVVALSLGLPFVLFLCKKRFKWLLLITIIFVVFQSESRGGIFILALTLLIYGFIEKRELIKRYSPILLIILIPIVINWKGIRKLEFNNISKVDAVFVAIKAYVGGDVYLVDHGSIAVRQKLIKNGIDALVNTNGWGVGAGASTKIQEASLNGNLYGVTSMHNFWVEMMVEHGLLMGLIFIGAYLFLTYKLLRIAFEEKENDQLKKLAMSCAVALFVFIFSASIMSSVIYFLPIWLVFGMSLSVIQFKSKFTI